MHVERNKELDLAWEFVTKTSVNVFLTGKAGTGKTTFLKSIVEKCPKRKIVLAPTGVAAINAGGMTLHSFFQLPFGLFLPEFQHVQAHDKNGRYRFPKRKRQLIRSLELMIIDEVSMLRADVMDELDSVLRKIRRNDQPFGGIQVLMIGDIQQLSPVVKDDEWEIMKKYYASPYFFDAKVLHDHPFRLIELSTIYRQRDPEFIEILGAVRENRMTGALLDKLNSRYRPDCEDIEGCITLCTHNYAAKNINDTRLQAIQEPEFTFIASISGNFPESMYPQDVELVLKKGAQVMFTKNDPNPERIYVNGTLGTVSFIDEEHITVMLQDGREVEVKRLPWENLKYEINEETKEIVSEIDGLFTQYPLKTAWAITIHKSQGLTFDKAIIDAGNSFSHGQVYVALSRCRTLEGLILKEKLSHASIINDFRVKDFNELVSESMPSAEMLQKDKRDYFLSVVKEMYGLQQLEIYYNTFLKFIRFTASELYPKAVELWSGSKTAFATEICDVGFRFNRTLDRIAGEDYLTSDFLQERIRSASVYFKEKGMEILVPLMKAGCAFEFDDQVKNKLYRQYFTNFSESVILHLLLWNYTVSGFRLEDFIRERAILTAEITDNSFSRMLLLLNRALKQPGAEFSAYEKEAYQQNPGSGTSSQVDEDILNPELFSKLKAWRSEQAERLHVPAYRILHQKTLIEIVNTSPSTESELLAVKGIGKKFIGSYGDEVLELINGKKTSLF